MIKYQKIITALLALVCVPLAFLTFQSGSGDLLSVVMILLIPICWFAATQYKKHHGNGATVPLYAPAVSADVENVEITRKNLPKVIFLVILFFVVAVLLRWAV